MPHDLDPTLRDLAQQARRLGLSPAALHDADEGVIREFALAVLREFAALGLVADEAEPGCYAARRPRGN